MENIDIEKQRMEEIIKLYKIIISKKDVTIKQLQQKIYTNEKIINNIRSKL
jgi:hypothetical protein